MKLSLEKQKRLVYAARRYYLEDQKQSDIARELGISRPMVSRLLAEAREFGVEIGGIEVAGSSFTAAAPGDELDITAHARKGYFFVKVRGRIDGEESELALTSPFYTEGR